MKSDNLDTQAVYDFYNGNYEKYGYSEKSLAWNRGGQNIRFERLLSNFNIKDSFSIFDIGCGFGDLNKYLQLQGYSDYNYVGVDLVDGFIYTARDKWSENMNIRFECGDFLNMYIRDQYDYVIASGIFNFKMHLKDNYQHIYDVMKKSFDICIEGIAFDFLSDKVDYVANDIVFHNSPEKVLSIAYQFSRNVVLDNSYKPFEFLVTVFKDDSFVKDSTTFCRFIKENEQKYKEGIF